jgi:hypothetical protein
MIILIIYPIRMNEEWIIFSYFIWIKLFFHFCYCYYVAKDLKLDQ